MKWGQFQRPSLWLVVTLGADVSCLVDDVSCLGNRSRPWHVAQSADRIHSPAE